MMPLSPAARRRIAGILAALALLLASAGARAGDPDLVYYTIHTEHFNIHFHQGLEQVAREVAGIAEEVHEKISIQMGWEVKQTTEIVITDTTDSANGASEITTKKRPQIKLYATAPHVDSESEFHDHWLTHLITHEYTHNVQIQIHNGISRVVNDIFGDIYLPNGLSPTWYKEGIAVLNETYETTAGRIRSSLYRMVMRAHALEGVLLELDDLSNSTRAFPRGQASYVYGAMFVDWLKRRFGTEKIVKVFHVYGAAPLPYGMNRAFAEAFGEDLVTLYGKWLADVRTEAEATRARIAAEGLTASTALTEGGEYKGHPVFAPDGAAVLVPVSDGDDWSGVYRFPLDGGPAERLILADTGATVSFDRSGRMIYTRPAPFKNAYRYTDVFMIEKQGADPRRLTFGVRARDAAISPRGDRIAMALNGAGQSELVLADDRGVVLRTLYKPAHDDQVFAPSWSPDGRRIAAVVRRGADVDIAVLDVASGEAEFLTADRALDNAPVFDPSGRRVVFTSDRSGVTNVYAADIETGELVQLTNVLTGAFYPAVSPDGARLAFLLYSARGYDLHVMPFAPEQGRNVAPPAEAAPQQVAQEKPTPPPPPYDGPVVRYNPLPSMLPRYWMLNAAGSSDGGFDLQLVTDFIDATDRHRIGAELTYRIDGNAFSGRAAYAYGGLGPGLHLGFSRSMEPRDTGYTVGGEPIAWTQIVTRGSMSLSLPILGVDRDQGLSISYGVTDARPRDEPDWEPDPRSPLPEVPRQYFRAGVGLAWSYSNTLSSPYGIGPEKGRNLSAAVDLDHPALGSEQTVATLRYAWSEYFGLPWPGHHLLAFRLNGAAAITDPPNQSAYSVGGYGEQNVVDVIWNNVSAGSPSLRGYPPGAFQGSHFHGLKAEYRLPIWFAEVGYATVPLYFKRIQASIFTDNAVISFGDINREDWRSSLGAEITWLFRFGYYQEMSIRTGYAYGFMAGGIHEIIIVFSGSG